MMDVAGRITAVFAEIQAEEIEEQRRRRRREIRAQLGVIPNGTSDTPETAALWDEYDELVAASWGTDS